jgi:two-component system, OmpR family, response regulator MprA
MRLLVVEDNEELARLLSERLRAEGYDADLLATAAEAGAATTTTRYAAVVLDLGLPDGDGLAILREIRQRKDPTPVLVLTARGGLNDRVTGLRSGADDYLVKPFALRELQARLRALLRRTGETAGEEVLRFEDLTLDPVAHEVSRGERQIELTKTEFLLLELFLRHPRQVLTRSQIFEQVWGYDFGPTSNALGVYMGYLRRKTEAGDEPRLLHTVRGVGYILRD